MMVPIVAGPLSSAQVMVDATHVFAPADHLTDEAFERIDRNSVGILERRLDNLHWRNQADIQGRSEDRMKQKRFVRIDRVFVVSKIRKTVFQKIA